MTWKSTVFVSGAGLLATWLASVPSPSITSKAAPLAAQLPSAPAAVSVEIRDLADGLEYRNRANDGYNRPSRNLFRFAPVRGTDRPAATPVIPTAEVAPEPPRPPMHLSGIAMDRVEERDVWTAILSTPTGVVLAREGDEVVSGWKVATIEAESVGLTHPDGSTLTLPLSGK